MSHVMPLTNQQLGPVLAELSQYTALAYTPYRAGPSYSCPCRALIRSQLAHAHLTLYSFPVQTKHDCAKEVKTNSKLLNINFRFILISLISFIKSQFIALYSKNNKIK